MVRNGSDSHAGVSPGSDLESTASLLKRVREGDATARDQLAARYLVILGRWARGRLPSRARDLADTDDLVQETLIRALDRIEGFEPRREGAFLAYLRRILVNRIRDEIRRTARIPEQGEIPDRLAAADPSPLEEAIGEEATRHYEAAMASLSEEEQEAVILRIELGFTHQQVAEAMGKPSANAARMQVARALVRLAEVMDGRQG